uniref:Putative isopenicillin-n-synthase n=1 Tax=Dryodora glandiformis TaxID=1566677 RepID=A0A0A0RW21_9METZ|nr:putative isopenicillin-n-synthase [Dryodora glandiformis]
MRTFGFFYVTDVPDYSAELELDYLKRFFDLPTETKMSLAVRKHRQENNNVYRGYGPVVETSGTQYKEMFNIGPHETHPATQKDPSFLEKFRVISREKSVWPESGDEVFDLEFKRVFQKGLRIRQDISRGVLRSIGRTLGHPELLDRFTHSEFSTLGLRRYPLRKSSNPGSNSRHDNVTLTELEHEDSTVTILATFNYTGLQALYKGVYHDVPPSSSGFIVNIGTLVEEITDRRVIAVRHRVRLVDFIRHSIPFFFNPSFDADISQSLTGRRTRSDFLTFGEWMADYLPKVEPGLLGIF